MKNLVELCYSTNPISLTLNELPSIKKKKTEKFTARFPKKSYTILWIFHEIMEHVAIV